MNRRQVLKNLIYSFGGLFIPFELFAKSKQLCNDIHIPIKIKIKFVPFKFNGHPIKTDLSWYGNSWNQMSIATVSKNEDPVSKERLRGIKGSSVYCPVNIFINEDVIINDMKRVYSLSKSMYKNPHITVFIDEETKRYGIIGYKDRFVKETK